MSFPFHVNVLGVNSALPAYGRHPTSQLVNISEEYLLLDCGEGTQINLRKNNLKFQRIEHIFISHLHGDHYFGVIGLLMTMQLIGRSKPLTIYAPNALEAILHAQISAGGGGIDYPIKYVPLEDYKMGDTIIETRQTVVVALEMKHGIPCWGFLVKEKKRLPSIIKEKIAEYDIPFAEINKIKAGASFIAENGKSIPYGELVKSSPKPRQYAFCTDTLPNTKLVNYIDSVDLLYHEATFTEEFKKRAKTTRHSTARQAAEIALQANVSSLLIGHYSSRYKELTPLLDEAKTIFKNAELAEEGKVYKL